MDKQVLFCHCKSNIVSPELENELTNYLNNSNLNITHIYDLCGICVEEKEVTRNLFPNKKQTLLIACHTRTIDSLIRFSQINNTSSNYQLINVRDLSYNEITNQINAFKEDNGARGSVSTVKYNDEWPSWFPVIDYNRCVNCGQCADFCLFGTYSKIDGKVIVSNPKACKNNCPACARLCPQTAIIFPKYKEGGAISGSSMIDEQLEQERRRNDTHEILGSDIYKTLENRKRKRQQLLKNEAREKAMKEREEALNSIKQNDIFNPFGNIKPAK